MIAAPVANDPASIFHTLAPDYSHLGREHFLVLPVDVQKRIIGVHTASVGSLTASLVHPREVFQPAILASAAAVVVVHNHPSGDPEPSAADRAVTKRLIKVGELIGIPLVDHVIIGDGRWVSLRERMAGAWHMATMDATNIGEATL